MLKLADVYFISNVSLLLSFGGIRLLNTNKCIPYSLKSVVLYSHPLSLMINYEKKNSQIPIKRQ